MKDHFMAKICEREAMGKRLSKYITTLLKP